MDMYSKTSFVVICLNHTVIRDANFIFRISNHFYIRIILLMLVIKCKQCMVIQVNNFGL